MNRAQHLSDAALIAAAERAGAIADPADHLENCESCARRLAEYRALLATARAPIPPAPKGLLERAIARAETEGEIIHAHDRITDHEGEKEMIPNAFTSGNAPVPGAESLRGFGLFKKFKARWLPEIAATAIVIATLGLWMQQRLTAERADLSPTLPTITLHPDHRFDHAPIIWETRKPRSVVTGPVRVTLTRVALLKVRAEDFSHKPYTLLIDGAVTPLKSGTLIGGILLVEANNRGITTCDSGWSFGASHAITPFRAALERDSSVARVPVITVGVFTAPASAMQRIRLTLGRSGTVEATGSVALPAPNSEPRRKGAWRIIIDHFKVNPQVQVTLPDNTLLRVSALARVRIQESGGRSHAMYPIDVEPPWTWSYLSQSSRPLAPGWLSLASGIALPELDAFGDPTPSKPLFHPADPRPTRPAPARFLDHVTLDYVPDWYVTAVTARFPSMSVSREVRGAGAGVEARGTGRGAGRLSFVLRPPSSVRASRLAPTYAPPSTPFRNHRR